MRVVQLTICHLSSSRCRHDSTVRVLNVSILGQLQKPSMLRANLRVLLILMSIGILHADQVDQKPDFKASVDRVEIPVRVLDNKGRFVRNLAQSDFEVLEDGVPQRIVSFSFNGVSSQHPPLPEVKQQRTSAQESSERFYAVVLDDLHISREDSFRARSVVLEFVRRYATADDSIAIVFTSGSRAQDFSRDRSVLSSALDRLRGQWQPSEPAALKEAKALGVIKLIGQVSRGFAETARGSRRAILLVTAGVGCSAASSNPSGAPWCGNYLTDALREAATSDVVVYSVDPRGGRNPAWMGPALGPRGGTGAVIQAMRGGDSAANFFDGMHLLANESGGFAVTGTDGFADAFKRIVSDFSEFYLLGYYSDRRDVGAPLRRNEVRVNRPGMKAFYRSMYVAPR